ncbi:2,3-bisphosphoglycerate-independent phosphoglycerate mutase [Patescibacteria group bacterium]|nr:2,3-bisphosphoglycerate-independent phosphoglycerate mutase [Patescibacteria group bacterium]
MKILLIIIDGLGDESIPQLGNRTPLEVAKTPNLDFLAKNGICGLVKVKFRGATPTSEGAHFSLFGYDPAFYKIRRGIITATGTGMKVKEGDVALRGNFATVDEKLNMIDRRAGRIKNTTALIKILERIKIDDVKFLLRSATEHRLGIIMRRLQPARHPSAKGGPLNLSPNISDGDPFYGKLGKRARKIRPLDKTLEAAFTAKILNEFLRKTHEILKTHPQNKKREKLGLPPANYLLVRGASTVKKLPSFKEKYGLRACCIAGKFLYQQIGKILGMDLILVKGANGKPNTNLRGKIRATKRALKKYDFVFLHIKATDSLAEDGNFLDKKKFIEKIDKNLKPILNLKNTLIVVTADHSTCSLLKRHCKKPVPILIYKKGIEVDYYPLITLQPKPTHPKKVEKFSERACQKGKLGKIKQINLMSKILLYRK